MTTRIGVILGAVSAGWIAAVAVVGLLVLAGRDTALERGEQSAAALALVLEEHTGRVFHAVSVTLGLVGDSLNRTPGLPANDAPFRLLLRQRLAELPFARALFVVGPDGFITHDTDFPSTPQVSLADRAYFRAHRDDPRLDLSVSSPVLSRSGLGWFVAVSRPLARGSEGFQGIAVAAVRPAYFDSVYRKLRLGPGDAIVLFHADGVLIAEHPGGEERVGKKPASLIFSRHITAQPSGTYRTSAGMYPGSRIVAYRTVEGLPLVVATSLTIDNVLAEWRRTALGAAVAMALLTLLLLWAAIYWLRQRRTREAIQEHRTQAEKLEALGLITGGIAHDFGNVLNIVSTNLHLLAMPAADAETRQGAIRLASRGVEHGAQLVDQLLAFARRRPLRIEPVRLETLLRGATPLLEQAAGRGITLTIDAGSGLPACLLDASQLEVALVNLIVNARDAMGGAGTIGIRAYDCADDDTGGGRADAVCLEVRDDGPGMSDEVRRRALEPFFTTKGESGTGLGLAQVYGFVQQVGGDVSIQSTPASGTTVRLYFRKARAA
jgi:two-component system, NtrC family, sensor kinase